MSLLPAPRQFMHAAAGWLMLAGSSGGVPAHLDGGGRSFEPIGIRRQGLEVGRLLVVAAGLVLAGRQHDAGVGPRSDVQHAASER